MDKWIYPNSWTHSHRDFDEMARLYLDGHACTEAADFVGMSHSSAKHFLSLNGLMRTASETFRMKALKRARGAERTLRIAPTRRAAAAALGVSLRTAQRLHETLREVA